MFHIFSFIIGVLRYNVVFLKHTKEWLAKAIFELTTQNFRGTLDISVVYKVLFDSSSIATEHSPTSKK